MKRKIFSVLIALVLVLSFSLVTAVPAAAAAAQVDSFALGVGSYSGTPASTAEWSTDQQHSGSYAVRLDSGIQTDQGDEAMIVIPMPARTTLADIESIAWSVFTVVGYPPHVDIYLDVDGDTVVDPEDVLTAEMAYNNAVLPFEITDLCALVQHDTWLQTFELAAEDGFGAVDADSIIWLSKLGGGPGDAPAGTLAQWKAGVVGGDPEGEIEAGVITGSAPVLRLEIEVDNWIIESEAYVDDIEINDVLFYDLELPAERPLTVDDDRVQNPNAYFQRIQSAIDCAIADEIISVAAGTYNEMVFIDKSLTLNGAKPGVDARTRTFTDESILDGTGLTLDVGVGAFNILDGVSNVIIDGFEVCDYPGSFNPGDGSAVLAYSYGAATQGLSQITIQNNYLHDVGWNGICVWSNNGVVQEDFTIQFNLIAEAPYAGIELTNVTNSQVLNNKIIAPTVLAPDPGDAGVGIEIAVRAQPGITISAGSVLVEGNEISGAFPAGSRAAINILSRTYSGTSIATLSGVTVRDNAVSGGGADLRAAILAVAESRLEGPATITNLLIEDNALDGNYNGIVVEQVDGGTHEFLAILDNPITDFTKGGIVVKDVLSVQIEGNIISTTDFSVAPNGIQIGYLIDPTATTGTVKGNQVSGCHWSGYDPLIMSYEDDWTGSGILVIAPNSALEISGNEVQNCDVGMDIETGTPTLITNNDVHDNSYGFVSYNTNPSISFNDIYDNALCGVYRALDGSLEGTLNAQMNWWGNASGPDGAQSFTPETYTGLLPGSGDKVSANVECRPWLTREFQTVLEDDIAYFGISSPALKGWNIVSTPLALDAHVTVTVDTVTYTANTWGGLLNLGKIAEVDDYALKLHYTLVDGVRVYTPIYYYDSNSDSPDFGWRKATASTEVNPVDAYYIRMMASDSIPIPFSPDLSVPSKKLYHGWNLVGCAYMDVMFAEDGQPLETALATIAEVSSLAGDVTGYSQVVSPPVNQMPWIFIPPETYIPDDADGTMLMGRGYWVFMENPGTLAGLTFTPISLSGPPAPPPPPGVVTEVSFQWYPVTEGSADYCESSDDDSFTYTLPWTFPFAGKDIVEIEVTSNGLIELLEYEETSDVTSSFDCMIGIAGDYPESDIIFAWNDDLDSGTYGFYGVEHDTTGDVVVVHWETETNDDEYETEFIPELNYFQLWLFPDGSIKWNFKEFNYVLYGYDLGTGIYDSTSQTFFNVAHAMGEPDGIFNTPEKSYEISGEYMP